MDTYPDSIPVLRMGEEAEDLETLRVRNSAGHPVRVGVWPSLLVWRPRPLDGLACHLQMVDEMWPSPHGGAIAYLRGVSN